MRLQSGDELIGIVVARPDQSLLTACENGYGKRTPFGIGGSVPVPADDGVEEDVADTENEEEASDPETAVNPTEESEERSGHHYRAQNRGGKGLRDIRTTDRNGRAVAILAVSEDDDVLMVTAGGKIQRVRAADISVVGRNTQGVRIIRLDASDKLTSMARIPGEIVDQSVTEGLPADEASDTGPAAEESAAEESAAGPADPSDSGD